MLHLKQRLVVAFFLAFLVWLFAFAGCNNNPTGPAIPIEAIKEKLSARFLSDVEGPGINRVVLRRVSGSFPLVLEVWLEEVADFYGFHFDLLYPYKMLDYIGFEIGTFLLVGGFGPIGGEAGVLRGVVTAENRQSRENGSGMIVRIFFKPIVEGEGRFDWRGYGTLTPGNLYETDKKNFGDIGTFGGSVKTYFAP